jgi:hypothetical protein
MKITATKKLDLMLITVLPFSETHDTAIRQKYQPFEKSANPKDQDGIWRCPPTLTLLKV